MGFPKALLRYREETFLDTLIGLFSARCSQVIVVLGAHGDRIREGTRRSATFVTNPDYQRGQTTSMQCGLRAVPPDTDGVLFTLVDHPAVQPATVDVLLEGRGMPSPLIRVPRYQGQRGHPVWFHREMLAEFLELPEGGAASQIVRSHAAETEFLDVDDGGILADIDDAAAYVRLTGVAL